MPADLILDEAFAKKTMPDLGLEIEDFQAQTWRIENWTQTAKRMVGPEFSCGGHKWYVYQQSRTPVDAASLTTVCLGVSCSSQWAMPTGSLTTWSRSTSTTPTPKRHQKGGTHVLSSVSPSPTSTTPPSTPPAVSLNHQHGRTHRHPS